MSQPSPSERFASLLPPDACREAAGRIEELRRRGCGGRVASVRLEQDGRVVVEVHREYYFGGSAEKTS